jgi:hypothetical protein
MWKIDTKVGDTDGYQPDGILKICKINRENNMAPLHTADFVWASWRATYTCITAPDELSFSTFRLQSMNPEMRRKVSVDAMSFVFDERTNDDGSLFLKWTMHRCYVGRNE